jgi:hypothetical protein
LSVGGSVGAGCEVEVAGWFGQVEGGQDGLVAAGEGGALRDAAVGGGQGDQVHAVEFVTQVAPGVAGAGFGDPDEKQCQPTQLDVGADAVLAVMVDRTQPEAGFAVAPAAFHGEQLLVGGGQLAPMATIPTWTRPRYDVDDDSERSALGLKYWQQLLNDRWHAAELHVRGESST